MNEERNNLKLWLIAGVAVLSLVALGWLGRTPYHHYKERHALKQAQIYFARGDYRNALLSASLALVLNPSNAPACRVMADLADLSQSPASLDWHRRLVEIQPTTENKLTLAAAGLHYQSAPFPLAVQILDDLAPTATNLVAYQNVAVELAFKMNDLAAAQAHLEAASRLEPTNQLFRLNLAVLRLTSTNSALAALARSQMERFCSDTNFAAAALRSLVTDRLARNDLPGAEGYATQLLATAQVTLSDRLQYLGLLQKLQSPELTVQLKSTQSLAGTNGLAAAAVASWMVANDRLTDAYQWLTNLPTGIQTQWPIRLAYVNYYYTEQDWTGLRSYTSGGNWGETDFLRAAFLSQAWSRLGDGLVADSIWQTAVGKAGGRFSALTALLDLSRRWQMNESTIDDLLWRIVQNFPRERWAQQDLERRYFVAGNTAKLKQLYARELAFSPQDITLKNNLAATMLLLKDNLPQACQLANDAYAQRPEDPVVVSTYAYSLHLQGRTQDGVSALEKLNPESLAEPSVALYYGVLLSALHETNRAAPFLAMARTKGQLLPEEIKLLAADGKADPIQ
jgi:tetratricopeptide (TPR) repeat protein